MISIECIRIKRKKELCYITCIQSFVCQRMLLKTVVFIYVSKLQVIFARLRKATYLVKHMLKRCVMQIIMQPSEKERFCFTLNLKYNIVL